MVSQSPDGHHFVYGADLRLVMPTDVSAQAQPRFSSGCAAKARDLARRPASGTGGSAGGTPLSERRDHGHGGDQAEGHALLR
jgi:hypothetical protein